MPLFHITTRLEWEEARCAGAYRAKSLEHEGFIHLSGDRQWLSTANRYFAGQSGLVLLVLDPDRLCAPVKMEEAHGEDFPHLYGTLNLDAVVEVRDLVMASDGKFLGG